MIDLTNSVGLNHNLSGHPYISENLIEVKLTIRARSLLFTPTTKLDKLDKARSTGADWIILDLEDGVAPDDRPRCRNVLKAWIQEITADELTGIALRINSLNTIDGIRDVLALTDWPLYPPMIVLPKVESAGEIIQCQSLFEESKISADIIAVFETAHGVLNAPRILQKSPPVAAIAFGSADYAAETGCGMDWDSLAWARGMMVAAAGQNNTLALDGVWLDFKNEAGLAEESERVAQMGFAGKIAIHPDQVGPINKVFTPATHAVDEARAMLAQAETEGNGAFNFRGRMVDKPILERAKRIVAAAG